MALGRAKYAWGWQRQRTSCYGGGRHAGRGLRGQNGPGQSRPWMSDCLVAQARTSSPVPGTAGWRVWRSTAEREDEPGGRLQPGSEPTAGLACVCPDRRAPALPLMGKACGQTSGSGTGNTQSIIRASGFLHCLTPASPERRCPPRRPPGTRRGGKGRRNVQREQCGKGSREGCSHSRICLWTPLQGLPRLDRVGNTQRLAAGDTRSVGAAAPGFHQSPGAAGISLHHLPAGSWEWTGWIQHWSSVRDPEGSAPWGFSALLLWCCHRDQQGLAQGSH